MAPMPNKTMLGDMQHITKRNLPWKFLWPLVCLLLVRLIIQTNEPQKVEIRPIPLARKLPRVCNVTYTSETVSILNSTSTLGELQHAAEKWLRPWSWHRYGSYGITTEQVDMLFDYTNSTELGAVRFVVRDGRPKALPVKFTRSSHYESRVNHWQGLLERVAWRFGLPDNLDIVFSTEDHPRVVAAFDTAVFAPLFVYATIPGFYDIPVPTTEYYAKFANSDIRELVNQQPWEERKARAVWRGSPTGGWFASYDWFDYPRSKLVNVSMHNPEIIDAKYLPCAWGQCADDVWPLIQKAFPTNTDNTHFTMKEYVSFKFLVDIDGNAWSSRFVDLLRTGCVIFKVASPYVEFFDGFLIPYRHYIPVAEDSSDLPAKVRWAIDHDKEMKSINDAAREVFYRFIGDGVWEEYASILLQRYSKLLPSKPSSYLMEKHLERFGYDTPFIQHLHKLWGRE